MASGPTTGLSIAALWLAVGSSDIVRCKVGGMYGTVAWQVNEKSLGKCCTYILLGA